MKYYRLRAMMAHRRVRIFELAAFLRMSDGALSQRLNGQYEFAPHLKTRCAEYFGCKEAWLFEEFQPPVAQRETAMRTPAMEAR